MPSMLGPSWGYTLVVSVSDLDIFALVVALRGVLIFPPAAEDCSDMADLAGQRRISYGTGSGDQREASCYGRRR